MSYLDRLLWDDFVAASDRRLAQQEFELEEQLREEAEAAAKKKKASKKKKSK
jgi:hypothetical protein